MFIKSKFIVVKFLLPNNTVHVEAIKMKKFHLADGFTRNADVKRPTQGNTDIRHHF
ncbi:hypothetical protein D3C72_2414310 [compost metagenome]